MQQILVLGAGFAGLWAAIGAARALDERGLGAERVAVKLINATPFHSIRVRNYEADLTPTRVPLADVLDPIGVHWLVGDVSAIDIAARSVTYDTSGL